MALSMKDGPLVVTGNLSPIQLTDWEEGPSCFADGTAVVDPRWVSGTMGSASGAAKAAYAIPCTNAMMALDCYPATGTTTNIVNVQGAGQASGFSLPLATGT